MTGSPVISRPRKTFLQAEWRYLAMLNYRIDPHLLAPFVPFGTEIDFFHGETYVSIIAFLFLNTKVLGVPIPFHRSFEEINLRFYVRRHEGSEIRRAAVFIQELVPKAAVALLARSLYNENYFATRMAHTLSRQNGRVHLTFDWSFRNSRNSLSVTGTGDPYPLPSGSLREFIADHYWGYVAQRTGDTVEYQVKHPSWRIWNVAQYSLNADVATLYGERFAPTLSATPDSVFLAEGSAVTLSQGRRIRRVPSRFEK